MRLEASFDASALWLYAATCTEYTLPDKVAAAAPAVFATLGADASVTSAFATGDAGDTASAGTRSTALTSLAALTPVVVGVDDAVAVTAAVGAGTSAVGGFAEAIVAAGDGQR
jgi:hypothetical protein